MKTDWKSSISKFFKQLMSISVRYVSLVIFYHILSGYAFVEFYRNGQLIFFSLNDLIAGYSIAFTIFLLTFFAGNANDSKIDLNDIGNFALAIVAGIISLVTTWFSLNNLRDNFNLILGDTLTIDKFLFVWIMLLSMSVFNYRVEESEVKNTNTNPQQQKSEKGQSMAVKEQQVQVQSQNEVVVEQTRSVKNSGQKPVANLNSATRKSARRTRGSTPTESLPQDSGKSVPFVIITPPTNGQSLSQKPPTNPKKGPSNP